MSGGWTAENFLALVRTLANLRPDIRVVLTFGRGDLYLALNKQTPDATVDKLRTALEQLRGEGRLQAISQKY